MSLCRRNRSQHRSRRVVHRCLQRVPAQRDWHRPSLGRETGLSRSIGCNMKPRPGASVRSVHHRLALNRRSVALPHNHPRQPRKITSDQRHQGRKRSWQAAAPRPSARPMKTIKPLRGLPYRRAVLLRRMPVRATMTFGSEWIRAGETTRRQPRRQHADLQKRWACDHCTQ